MSLFSGVTPYLLLSIGSHPVLPNVTGNNSQLLWAADQIPLPDELKLFKDISNVEKKFSVLNSSGNHNDSSTSTKYSNFQIIPLAVLAGFLSLLTVAGNIMVMVSFKIDKQLQTISNYFLFSLAVADFAIGLISMPLYTMYILLGEWILGPEICDSYLALDYLMSNASVLNLLIISFDRYFSVTRPLTYRAKRTNKRAAVMIASAWIISLALWPPWIYSWPYIEGKRTVPENQCFIQFLETNTYITFGTAIAAFYLPVTVMCVLYWRIWRETQQRQKDLFQLQADNKLNSKKSNSSDEHEMVVDLDEWTKKKMEPNKKRIDEAELTYVPTSLCIESQKQSKSQKLKCWWKIKNWILRKNKCSDKSMANKELTMNSINCPSYNPSSFYESSPPTSCYSFNFLKEVFIHPVREPILDLNLPLNERLVLRNEALPALIGERLATGGTPPAEHKLLEKSQSNDSVYTIVIKLPNGELHRSPSIKMIEGKTERASNSFHSLLPRDEVYDAATSNKRMWHQSKHQQSSSSPIGQSLKQMDDACIPLDAKVVPKQLIKAGSRPAKKKKKKSQEKKQDRKAAKTLCAILLAFIITWTPYNVLVLLKTLLKCEDDSDCIPNDFWSFSYYLCYINSTVNPVCYALCNASFRRTYMRILTCKWRNRKRVPMNR